MPEHPRVRGDHPSASARSILTVGTPPRARGSPGLHRPDDGGDGEHPRVRGDHAARPSRIRAATGTPPRARGSLRGRDHDPARGGNTPACAGITSSRSRTSESRTEHPRVRGDHGWELTRNDGVGGTPPRARGSQRAPPARDLACRNTPACAGITAAASSPRTTASGTPPRARGSRLGLLGADQRGGNTPACAGITPRGERPVASREEHPRVRGDHPVHPAAEPLRHGTPPRARGSHLPATQGQLEVRNTPACAGITYREDARERGDGEHPRVRGDHAVALFGTKAEDGTPRVRGDHPHLGLFVGLRRGTPPRARGSPRPAEARRPRPGNTPACAGITLPWQCLVRPGAEHPRVRGDHEDLADALFAMDGTPPRARGSRSTSPCGPRRTGNTPACAGITASGAGGGCQPGEHPRVRGDHAAGESLIARQAGTPPRARGSRPECHARGRPPRNTPACAGITFGSR